MRFIRGYGVGYSKNENGLATKGANIFTNFNEYGFKAPQIMRADINNPCFRLNETFDAIICDPPYGYRAFSRQKGMEDTKKTKRIRRLKKKYGKVTTDKSVKEIEEDPNKINEEDSNKIIEEDSNKIID
jgi:23S rRNA G2445 N2-methylase RlmL